MCLVSIAQNAHSIKGTKNLFSWKSKNVEVIKDGENTNNAHNPTLTALENLKFLHIKYSGITPLATMIA
jgi:hypothetical protein